MDIIEPVACPILPSHLLSPECAVIVIVGGGGVSLGPFRVLYCD